MILGYIFFNFILVGLSTNNNYDEQFKTIIVTIFVLHTLHGLITYSCDPGRGGGCIHECSFHSTNVGVFVNELTGPFLPKDTPMVSVPYLIRPELGGKTVSIDCGTWDGHSMRTREVMTCPVYNIPS